MKHNEIDPLHRPYMKVLKAAEELTRGYTKERDHAFHTAAAELIDTAKSFVNPLSAELDVRIATAPLSTRLKNVLKAEGVVFVGDIYTKKIDARLMKIFRNSSVNQANELNTYLKSVHLLPIGTPPTNAAESLEFDKNKNELHAMMDRVIINWRRPSDTN